MLTPSGSKPKIHYLSPQLAHLSPLHPSTTTLSYPPQTIPKLLSCCPTDASLITVSGYHVLLKQVQTSHAGLPLIPLLPLGSTLPLLNGCSPLVHLCGSLRVLGQRPDVTNHGLFYVNVE